MNPRRPKLEGTYDDRAVERHIAQVTRRHREELSRFVQSKRAQGLKSPSIRNYTNRLRHWLDHIADHELATVSSDSVTGFLTRLVDVGYNGAMITQAAILIKAFMEHALADTPRPKSFWRAFKRRAPPPSTEKKPPTKEEIELMINAARSPQARSVISVMADSGFRLSELTSLNVGSVVIDEDDTAWLSLPPDAPRLKTGPRTVPVLACVPHLRTHLHFHPMRNEPDAPLFYNERRGGGRERITGNQVRLCIKWAAARADVRHIHPHLLRHARATQASRDGWNEVTMRRFFGWAKGSDMPDHYSHLTNNDVKNAVLKSAGRGAPRPPAPVTPLGSAPQVPDLLAAFGALGDLLQAAQQARKVPPT